MTTARPPAQKVTISLPADLLAYAMPMPFA
jgi:hypothetical protein